MLLNKITELFSFEHISSVQQQKTLTKLFIQSEILKYLPIDENENILFSEFELSNLAFHQFPEAFQENFTKKMESFLMLEPQKSLTLLALFAEQFETLENPWPLLDILLKKKHYFQKSQFGKDYLSILLYLVRNFSNYRKQRIELLRPFFCSFILLII